MPSHSRLWTTGLAAGQGLRFDELAATHSLPLFKTLPGCLGAVFARTASKGYVLTTWLDEAHAEAASASPPYLEAVRFIGQSGVMAGEQSLEAIAGATGAVFDGASGRGALLDVFMGRGLVERER